MLRRLGVVVAAAAVCIAAGLASAAPPRFGPATIIVAPDGATVLEFATDAPVEAEAFPLDAPPRIVLDLPEMRWRLPPVAATGLVARLRHGLAAPGRARLVIDLAGPALVASVEPSAAGLTLRLEPVSDAAFAAAASAAAGAALRPDGPRRAAPVVAIDPGHGGHDPGAIVGGIMEKDVVLAVALDLAEALREAGLRVVLTREDDRFLPLDARVAVARSAGAALLLSLHADTVTDGEALASGASVYLPAARATDALAERLAAQENAAGASGPGILPAEGSDVALLLSDLARRRTAVEGRRLGPALVEALAAEVPVLASRPLRAAAFRVLAAPDVPSALVELGFLSHPEDRKRLVDPAWQAAAVRALAAGVLRWLEGDNAAPCAPGPCHRRD